MITLKTGVPGSGKTLSIVSELLQNEKLPEPRALYTNITGLAIPHVFLHTLEAGQKPDPNLLYTTDWRKCPAGSLIVIDEAFMFGYDAKSASTAIPDYIRDLAVHRKDYSVDIVFIAQHPKLLHVALRRQVGKHQHYRRLFGWGRAVCYEWDMAQENLSATKTAVVTQFSYPRSVFKAYKSAEVHTKPAFKLPWFVWIPVALVPLAAWAVPQAFTVLSGSMTGKGIQSSAPKPSTSVSAPASAASAPPGFVKLGENPPAIPPGQNVPIAPPSPGSAYSAPPAFASASPYVQPVYSGCIAVGQRCSCLDTSGKKIAVEPSACAETVGVGRPPPAQFPDSPSPAAGRISVADQFRLALSP